VLQVWDLDDQILLQNVKIEFPSVTYGRIPDFGPFPVFLFDENDNSMKRGRK
jgi:hypothetical protein